ncbi:MULTISPECIES: hypothetical protein [Leisingera]|jgi:hypothetical protein|uniref:hypothetical protein n=1 Tax=Leisingera TaxID=191028 RepID=UPI001152CE83|nr:MULTISPECIES: hypothetical protein [Leisingera]QDI75790.1 hypothetical protein R2C4_08550 [Leisingera aquaemixtae]
MFLSLLIRRAGLLSVLSAGAILADSTVLQAAPLQHSCLFDHVAKVTKEGMQRADVSLRVTVARRKRSGRVIVDGSGDYKARAKSFDNGAVEYFFKTGVSKETITISPQGEALWDIRFRNEDYMVYVGTCGAVEVSS